MMMMMHELNAVAEIGLTSLSLHFPTKSLICPIVHVTILFVCYTNTVTEFLFIKVSNFYRVTLCRARSCESKSSVCLLILWRWCRPMFFSHVLEFFENNFESVAIAVKTARCRCKLRYVPKFTAASRGAPCDSTAVVTESPAYNFHAHLLQYCTRSCALTSVVNKSHAIAGRTTRCSVGSVPVEWDRQCWGSGERRP